MKPLSDQAQALLEAARASEAPPAAAKAAIRSALGARIAAVSAAGAATAAAAKTAAAAAGATSVATASAGTAIVSAGAIKLAIVAAVAMGAGTFVTLQVTRPPEEPAVQAPPAAIMAPAPRPRPVPAAAPTAPVEEPAVAPEMPLPAPSPTPAPAIGHSPAREVLPETPPIPSVAREEPVPLPPPPPLAVLPQDKPAATGCDLSQELKLLYLARGELQQHHADRTLTLVDQLTTECPSASLGQEAEALRVLALCELGRTIEGREAAARFEAASPRSPLVNRIHAACGLP